MSAHEEVARQLAESVARRRAWRSFATAPLGRWWRGHIGASGLATALCGALMVLALGAAGSFIRVQHGAREAAVTGELVAAVGAGEAPCPPCRAVGGRLHGPLSDESGSSSARPGQSREVLVRRGLPAVVWGAQRG